MEAQHAPATVVNGALTFSEFLHQVRSPVRSLVKRRLEFVFTYIPKGRQLWVCGGRPRTPSLDFTISARYGLALATSASRRPGAASSFSDEVAKSHGKKSDLTGLRGWRGGVANACMGEQRGYITETFVVVVNMHVASNFLREAA